MTQSASYACLAASVLLGIAGQIALKIAATSAVPFPAQLFERWTLVGLAIYFLAALCYILALKRIPLSLAFPSVSASYVIVALLAHLLWNEPFGWPQIGGIALISSGILLIHQ